MKHKKLSIIEKLRLLKIVFTYKAAFLLGCQVILLLAAGLFPSLVLNLELNLFNQLNSTVESLNTYIYLVITIVFTQVGFQVINSLYYYINYLFSSTIQVIFQKALYQKIEHIKIESFENSEFYNLLYRVRQNSASNLISMLTNIFNIIKNLITIISLSIVLSQIHFIFPIVTIICSVPYVFLFRKMNFNNYFFLMNNSSKTRRNHYLIDLLTQREYAKEVRTYDLYPYLFKYHVKLRDELFDETYELVRKYTIYTGVLSVLKRIVQIGCLFVGLYFIVQKKMGVGQFAILMQTISSIQSTLLQIMEAYKTQNNQNYHLGDLYELLQMESEQTTQNMEHSNMNCNIVFDNVSFEYPNSENRVLNHISLNIPFGQKIAIVGENGSGKTTFAYLLSGLFQPTEGNIKIGNTNLSDIYVSFRKHIAFIFQNFLCFKGTVKENLMLGNCIEMNDSELFEALKLSNASDFVNHLPEKENTNLGFLNKDSVDLSGGEWQKLAISRALCKKDVQLLIMDEFAASLDPFTESNLYEQFNHLTEGKTAISISHRLGITRYVDRVLVFDHGQIVEDGTHDELMKKHGLYYKMYIAQRELYQ